jgi:2-dehydropantoate 2-reductase
MGQTDGWPRIAVVGAGAVGGYFGGMLAHAGAPVVMIGRKPFADAVRERGLFLDTLRFQTSVRVETATEASAAGGANLILFCVKTTDTSKTARELAPFVERGARVISLQNGVDNIEKIRAVARLEAMPAVVYVASSVPEPGHIKHVGRGDLVIGPESRRAKAIAEIFMRANIPCRISDNILGDLWTKLLWNCALNAISALGQARYGEIAANAEARKLVKAVVDEVMMVARAAGVVLPGIDDLETANAGAMQIATQMAGAMSSTAQDLNRGKRTEIDSLNGYVVRLGAELGVPTPINHALVTLVKLMEDRQCST